jgi:recombinational DNA repair protein RecT
MVKRSGAAREVQANPFYANEILKYEQGTRPYIEHHPIYEPKDRGELVGGYAWARVSAYRLKIAVLSAGEIDAIRLEKSEKWKKGPLQPWYVRKTMIHQVTKELTKTRKIRELLREFEVEQLDQTVDVDPDLVAPGGMPASA